MNYMIISLFLAQLPTNRGIAAAAAAAAVIVDSTSISSTTLPPTTAPPVPPVILEFLPPEFSDIPSDSLVCYGSSVSAAAINAFVEQQITSLATVLTGTNSTTYLIVPSIWSERKIVTFPGLYTTLCDGYTRNTVTEERTVWKTDEDIHVCTIQTQPRHSIGSMLA